MNKKKYHDITENFFELSRYLDTFENKRMREILFDNTYSFNQVKTAKQIEEITEEEERELMELEERSVLKLLEIQTGNRLIDNQTTGGKENV